MSGDQIVTIVASFVSGGLGCLAALFAYAHGYLNIERIERRKQKISLAQELVACRYVLVDGYVGSDADIHDFNRALALIPFVFSEHKEVVAAYDSFMNDKSNANLFILLERSIEATGLKQYAMSRTHIAKTLSISRPQVPVPVICLPITAASPQPSTVKPPS